MIENIKQNSENFEFQSNQSKEAEPIPNGTEATVPESDCDILSTDKTGEETVTKTNNCDLDNKTVTQNGCKSDVDQKTNDMNEEKTVTSIKLEGAEAEVVTKDKAAIESNQNGVAENNQKSTSIGLGKSKIIVETAETVEDEKQETNQLDKVMTKTAEDSKDNEMESMKMPVKEPDKECQDNVDNVDSSMQDPSITGETESQVSEIGNSIEVDYKKVAEMVDVESTNNEKANENKSQLKEAEKADKELEQMESAESKSDSCENKVSKVEAPTHMAELAEQSDSTGPPSLTKEVETDDNSVTSDLHRNEEPMELEDVPAVLVSDNKSKDTVETMSLDNQTKIAESKSEVTNETEIKEKINNSEEQTKTVESLVNTTPSNDSISATKQANPEGIIKPSNKIENKQGQKLDQLVSKITQKAVTEEKKAPRQAKARKSCATAHSSVVAAAANVSKAASNSQGLAMLTFNVKELEKQGVLDIPKPSKRKAFEPVKIPSPEKVQSQLKTSPVRSPVMKKKFMKGHRRKKGKRMGAYRLPGEKNHKKLNKNRKTDSEERECGKDVSKSSETNVEKSAELTNESKDPNTASIRSESYKYVDDANCQMGPVGLTEPAAKVVTGETSSEQLNALQMITKNAKRSFSTLPISIYKKAKKTVKPAIDPATHRTLESFLKTGSHSQVVSPGSRKVNH